MLFAIIATAVFVQLGRAVFPVLDDYRDVVEQQISRQLRVVIDIRSIEAEWHGLRPQLRLMDVAATSLVGEPIFQVEQVDVEVGLLSSLRDWRLAFRTLTFRGLKATVKQHESGRWQINSLSLNEPDPLDEDRFSINDPLDIFLFGRRVELHNTQLKFDFRSGLESDIEIPTIRLENDSDFHRLAAEFSIDDGGQALSLIVEGQGDPRDSADFDAQGYLTLKDFPSEKVLAAIGITNDVLLGDDTASAPPNWRNTGQVDLRLWFQGTGTKGIRWRGDMEVSGVPVIPPQGMVWPDSLTTSYSGEWHPEAGWFVDLADAQLAWRDFTAPALTARVRGKLGEPSQLQVEQVDVGAWYAVIDRAGLIPGDAASILESLAPYGFMRNIEVTQTNAESGYFTLRANIEDAGVHPWQGVPAIEGVSGYVETTAFDGHVLVGSNNGFVLDFPQIYKQPLPLQTANGDVRWQVDLDQRLVSVSSGTLHVSNSDIAAVGHFNLRLPFVSTPGVEEPELTLVIGVRRGVASLHRLLVPYTIPTTLYEWLDNSIKNGVIRDAGFIYHGSVLKKAKLAQVVQLSASVEQGELVFDPSWPALTSASAVLLLDDNDFTVSHLRGDMLGVHIHNAEVALAPVPGEKEKGIAVKAQVSGDSGKALALLKQSPIRDILGEQLASWQVTGPMTGNIDLLIPLQNDSTGAKQNIALNFEKNQLHIPQLDLTFEQLSGPFTYSNQTGVSSQSLQGKLWGQSVQARLASAWSGMDKQVQLDFAGQMDVSRLQQWSKRPELSFAHGISALTGTVTVPLAEGVPITLEATSMLQGVHLNLPEPFNKPEQDTRLLKIDINAYSAHEDQPQMIDYTMRLQDQAQMRIQTHDNQVTGIGIALGESVKNVEAGWLSVYGHLPEADLQAWNQALQSYLATSDAIENATVAQPTDSETPELPVKIAMSIQQMHLGSLTFESVQLQGGREQQEWIFDVQSPAMIGSYRIRDDEPIDVQLSYLKIPGSSENSESREPNFIEGAPSALAQLDISDMSEINFSCAELWLEQRELGEWAFKLRPINGGVLAYDIVGDSMGAHIDAIKSDSQGAQLIWLRSELGDLSYFSGRMTMGDIGSVLTQLGQEQILTSDEAQFDLDMQWAGAPDALQLNNVLGNIDLNIERGRFIRGAEVGENPVVKLLGLLNFDTLARRLRLDFSDLNPEGLGYEKVQGRLALKEGVVEVAQPLEVDSPASHLQFVGNINMLNQTVDAQLVTTFPLTGNLTMAAALTGVLPAAVGVFVVGKLFKQQFDKVSSIRYSIDGDWNDPKVEVEKVFENQTDHGT